MNREQLERLARGVAMHADPERGLTNVVVERFCRLIGSPQFAGVFAADGIDESLASRPSFSMVVNLGEVKGRRRGAPLPVGHFVAVVAAPHAVRYMDSYGLPCTQRHVARFLRLCGREVRENTRQVQDYDSKCCGFYASLFATYYDTARPPPDFRLVFYRRRLKENDELCFKYLRRLIYS